MIGNDIVDLRLLHQHPRSGELRFQKKVLSEQERVCLHTSSDPALDVWYFWALKESAYKCYFQRTRRRFFAPKKFVCEWDRSCSTEIRQGRVETPVGVLHAEIRRSGLYLHALCCNEQERLAETIVQVFSIPERDIRRQSDWLRAEVLDRIAQQMDCPPAELAWDDTAGHPRMIWRGVVLPVDISLSHHGAWGAAAWFDRGSLGFVSGP